MNQEHFKIVSVIITGKNAEAHIEATLNAVLEQKTRMPYEVIYVDGGSSDDTVQIVKRKSQEYDVPIRIILSSEADVPSKGRNTGLKTSIGDIIAFVDTDCVLPHYWIDTIVSEFEKGRGDGIACVGGGYIPDPTSSFINKVIYFVLGTYLCGASAQFRYFPTKHIVKSLPAGNCAYLRSILGVTGGFDERLSYCEDYDLNSRLRKNGYKILAHPDLYCKHLKNFNLLTCTKYFFRYGQGRARAITLIGSRLVSTQVILMLLIPILLVLFFAYFKELLYYEVLRYAILAVLPIYIAGEIIAYRYLQPLTKLVIIVSWPLVICIAVLVNISYFIGFIWEALRTLIRKIF